MSKLDAGDRDKLPNREFAFPKQRKEPLELARVGQAASQAVTSTASARGVDTDRRGKLLDGHEGEGV